MALARVAVAVLLTARSLGATSPETSGVSFFQQDSFEKRPADAGKAAAASRQNEAPPEALRRGAAASFRGGAIT